MTRKIGGRRADAPPRVMKISYSSAKQARRWHRLGLRLALFRPALMLPDMIDQPPSQMTLDELRRALAPLLPQEAAFDGWGEAAVAAAARALGVPADRARLAFPGGAIDMIDAWFEEIDFAMAAALPPEQIAGMKIRARIRALVLARLEAMAPHREALRRALAVLGRPSKARHAARLGWRAADQMWRLAGDKATDFNHYSKRATLAALYGATILAWMDDESEDWIETRAFLDRRIDGVMRFEKWKAQLRPDPERHFSPVRFLGRLRYPAV
ncbi:MAG: rpsU-divergently transcribed protein [Sphingomonas bacterium]|nr:rpsU-divergently transcribed protein [Sphingomonas bacterium]